MPEKKARENNDIAIVDFLDLDPSKSPFSNQNRTSTMEVKLASDTMEKHYMSSMKE